MRPYIAGTIQSARHAAIDHEIGNFGTASSFASLRKKALRWLARR
jgi:hypothetical protein